MHKSQIATICLSMVALLSLTSCAPSKPVELDKKPLVIKRISFDPKGDMTEIPLEKDEGAVTVWSFGCKTDFDFEIVEKTFLSKTDYMVTIKIKSCRITLTAPVTVYLPENADKKLIEHEDGHVEICRRIYDGAEKHALIAASQAIGKQYQASGVSVEAACKQAVEDASLAISQTYHDRASASVNRISEIYDALDRDEPGPAATLVEKAFTRQLETRAQ
jgi:hypothetical protein